MVEIAKALSYRSRVLIMDEPTAALNDAEINELFSIIRRLKAEGVGIVYISHKMDELKRIADRVTVMRDGEYVDTVPAETTPVEKIISMMVGRTLSDERPEAPDHTGSDGRARGEEPHPRHGNPRRQLLAAQGRDPRLCRADGRRPHRGGARHFRRRSGRQAARCSYTAARSTSASRRTPSTPASAISSEDRKQFGLVVGMDVRNNVAMASVPRFTGPGGLLKEAQMKDAAVRYIDLLAIKTPSDKQEVRLLSGGNQQKIVIAKWLLRDCDVLIFDEPTRGIDVGAKSEIYRLLNDLAARGKAIIVISSELPEVLRVSHRIAVMCEGRLTGFLPARASQEEIMHLATQRSSVTRGVRRRGRGSVAMSTVAEPAACKTASNRFSGAQHRLLAFSGLIVLVLFFTLASPNFMQTANMITILQATSVNGVLAIAATLVIISGGIDLSVGTLMTFCAVIAGVLLTYLGLPMARRRCRRAARRRVVRRGVGRLHRQAQDPAFHRDARHDADLQGPVAGDLRRQADLFQRHARLHQDLRRLADRRRHPGLADTQRRAHPVPRRNRRRLHPGAHRARPLHLRARQQRGGAAPFRRQHRPLENRRLCAGRRRLRRCRAS